MRTIDEIKKEITDAWMHDEVLAKAYGYEVGSAWKFSRVSIENVLCFIMATVVWTHERLFERHREEVEAYIAEAAKKSDIDRTDATKTKTGCPLKGVYAINPVNGKEVPVFIGDFVLGNYGTGAVMAVPSHDQRDFEYAIAHNIPMIQVIEGRDVSECAFEKQDYLGKGCKLINSEEFTGLTVEEAKEAITCKLEKAGVARRKNNYHFREWIFARQRYWGEPVPCVYTEDGRTVFLPDEELPVILPELEEQKGLPEAVLGLLIQIEDVQSSVMPKLVRIAADGRISEEERDDYSAAVGQLQELIRKAFAIGFAKE